MSVKRPSDSLTTMTQLVMPNDTNILGKLFGGQLLHWMDVVGALAASKHCRHVAVTAAANNISFKEPIELGETVTLVAKVVRSFNTSMEVYIEVFAEKLTEGISRKCNDAYFTYVALDDNKRPTKVPDLQPLTSDEQELFDKSLIRKQLKLLMAKKIKLSQAPELQQQIKKWETEV
ncbi:MAG: acyl-CoA thioesterase [Bacteroidetes bacterium]|nr:acyl-CoA thioesterase [Bacteroidota bacterium]